MTQEWDVNAIGGKIQALKQMAIELKAISGGIQAIDRNVDRILASIKMLELNILDMTEH